MSDGARFKGRVAVVTGAASGSGLGVARRLATEGARLSLWDRDAAGLKRAATELGGKTHHVASTSPILQPSSRRARPRRRSAASISRCERRHHRAERAARRIPARRVEARLRRECARALLLQQGRARPDARQELRAHRQHRLRSPARKASPTPPPTAPARPGSGLRNRLGKELGEDRNSRQLRDARPPRSKQYVFFFLLLHICLQLRLRIAIRMIRLHRRRHRWNQFSAYLRICFLPK